jgi:protein O-GlcNAc transferase
MTLQEQFESGLAHHRAGRVAEAERVYREVLARQPNHAQAYYNLGIALIDRAPMANVAACFREAIRIKPDYGEAYVNLGVVLVSSGLFDEAFAVNEEAVRLLPNNPKAHYNLAILFQKKGEFDEAIAEYREAIRINPGQFQAYSNLGMALQEVGQLDEAIAAFRNAIRLKPELTQAYSNLLLTLHYHPGENADSMYAEGLRQWKQVHAEPLKKFIRPYSNSREPERRLRIGYVSSDYYDHASAFFLMPLLKHHNRENFEIVCYANNARNDGITRKIQNLVQQWRKIQTISDQEAAELVRKDGIDILVDLKLHTGGNRLLMFAQKPAPVQVTWLGYPGTTGLDTVDYRLTDPFLNVPGHGEAYYSEKSVHLPETFWCYDPLTNKPEVNALPGINNKFITFGCLNNFCKINDPVLKLWGRVLKSVEASRLLMLCPEGRQRQAIANILAAQGIDRGRIEMIARIPRPKYLEMYHRIDLGLDSFPCNGHTTSMDSLWMGVPFVTLVSKPAFGRAGLSQLSNLGLTELVAYSGDEYVRIAADLAKDLPRLAELRRTLRQRMQNSPLMDGAKFARNVEAAYRTMWRAWCESGGQS